MPETIVTQQTVTIKSTTRTRYVSKQGEKTDDLVLKSEPRANFFQQRPQLKNLLLRQPFNPILEEGRYAENTNCTEERDRRDRIGEYYLGPEGLWMWIQQKFYDDPRAVKKYNNKNIFIVDNSPFNFFLRILDKINLQDGEDAKFIMLIAAHTIPVYMRNDGGKIKCFIMDSMAGYEDHWPKKIIRAVRAFYPDAAITLSSTMMQHDYYSCNVFAMIALIYFAAHGAEIFPYIEKQGTTLHAKTGCQLLAEDKLIPALIRLTQTLIPLPDSALDTIVSDKKQLTLRQYLEKYVVSVDGKMRNIAAIAKKYKFFAQVSDYIQSHTQETISSNPEEPLPASLFP